MNILVTGLGLVSAAGKNVHENLHSLKTEKSGIKFHSSLGAFTGSVKLSNVEIIDILNLKKSTYSRSSLLGMIAAKEAWANNQHSESVKTGFISGTSVGGLDKIESCFLDPKFHDSGDLKQSLIYENGGTSEEIAKFLSIDGFISTISTACSSGANAILQGAKLIEHGILDRVVVGGVDPLTNYNLRGFSSLMVYDQEPCKPFDENRKGLNLGEGAAYLILENENSINLTGNTPICRLTGWSNASDAFHQTASSDQGRGATLSMNKAIERAKLAPTDIDYVNAHGTGTKNNDLTESVALKNVFDDQVPPFSSTKSITGHTLAASGAIEAIYSIAAVVYDWVLPNINFSNPIVLTNLVPQIHFETNSKIKNTLTNSFGFGGNCTSLVFSKI